MRRTTGKKHVIEFTVDDARGFTHWACDCGIGGTVPNGDTDDRIENHVGDDAVIVYRYISLADWNR